MKCVTALSVSPGTVYLITMMTEIQPKQLKPPPVH